MSRLSVSIVSYAPDLAMLVDTTLGSLAVAVLAAKEQGVIERCEVVIVDNGPGAEWRPILRRLQPGAGIDRFTVRGDGENLGYGRGHNLAVESCTGDWHLILNPDVKLHQETLVAAIGYLKRQPKVGMITPRACDDEGRQNFLCKRYPAVLDLLVRGFGPALVRRWLHHRLDRYEMRDVTLDAPVWDVPIASGCFMLFRRSVLDILRGFDPAYFLYFEDFDISLRAASCSTIAYLPEARIVHYGGGASRKGWRHVRMFAVSALRFYRTHGWKWV